MTFEILNASKHITGKYNRYLKTLFDIEDPEYKTLYNNEMNKVNGFSKGPILEVIDSFAFGDSVKELINKGILNADFECIPDIYKKRLYAHQIKSIMQLRKDQNIVVSTGTGSGKTESFLIPILNSLMNEKLERGYLSPGVRALLIYPMNALANDQICRLRELLKDYPDITFGAYTGQTKEKNDDALRKYKSLNGGENPLSNELISREQMKETPPNILITNYSMLEYLMLRPQDNCFFQGRYANNWKYIVLDEAHTYSGSTGIEVSMLLRRLKGFLKDTKIRFILTSATLGSKKSDNEVINFATNLCDATFISENVIRAQRINILPDEENLKLSNIDYQDVDNIINSGYEDDRIKDLLTKHFKKKIEENDYYEFLYNLLRKDQTFWKIKNYLINPQTVNDLCKYMNWKVEDVTHFVNVASKAIKGHTKLFDARYHLFIRATEGVFITLGKKKVSLIRQNQTYINNEKYQYFEIATCSQCRAIYLLGKIEERDQKSYFTQTSNNGNNIKNAFLLGETADEVNEINDEQKADQFEICPHCGFIRRKNEVHKTCCEHLESEYVPLTQVHQSERTGKVTKCIKCSGVNNIGILRSFFSGQEASTSVIGTALFEELPSKEKVYEQVEDNDFFEDFEFDDYTENYQQVQKAKQFLAFSDSRQAAAYFSTYFSETYQKLLNSRLVYNSFKRLSYEGKPIVNFIEDLSASFREFGISQNLNDHPDYLKEAWKAVLRELVNSYSRNSLMGLGMFYITFEDSVRIPSNTKMKFSKTEISDLFMVWIQTFFEENAIYHGQAFTDSDIAFYSNNGAENCFVFSNTPNKYIKTFIPRSDANSNKRIDYLERILKSKDVDYDLSIRQRFMRNAWDLLNKKEIFVNTPKNDGHQINIKKFKVLPRKNWYCCSKCQRITPYNISGVCPAYRCTGQLESINIEDRYKDNHYYRMYNEMDIRPMRVVEHTAQLSNEKAYYYQEMFKNKEIDVLSCSTTFEMGVDIGELETVFMRNMPPTPANYIQRAGRAGRGTKSAALALTFCNKSNHDFTFFEEPLSMIKGEIQPPLFKVENEKIGIRHLYAVAISFFWKEFPHYYGTVSTMFGEQKTDDGYFKLKEYLESHPQVIKDYLYKSFPKTLIKKFEIDTFGWTNWLFDLPNDLYPNLKMVFNEYRNEVDSLYKEKSKIERTNKVNYAIIKRINTYTNENIISFLSRKNILPKYGFPVDTVELNVNSKRVDEVLGLDLSRDLAIAISEYAPGCEIVANGKLITSRYIKKVPNKSWRLYDYVLCPKCRSFNVTLHHESDDFSTIEKCEQCGMEFDPKLIKTFLIPEFGFISETNIKIPTLIKPERTYRSEAAIVSHGTETLKREYKIGKMTIETSFNEDGEIAILNKTDFYVCPSCGYSLGSFETAAQGAYYIKKHENSAGYRCQNQKLKMYSIGYRFKTDALYISLNTLYSYDEAFSILQAIILSVCKVLNIDDGEVAGCLQSISKQGELTYDFIIYDTTPGGAGHVRRLNNESIVKKVIFKSYEKARSCNCGGKDGDTSCYKCLRTYQNQFYHDHIKRKYVIGGLEGIINASISNSETDRIILKK